MRKYYIPNQRYNVLKEVNVMSNETMGKITISLSKEAEEKLRKRAERNLRSISKEVEFMLLEAENRDKVK